MKGKLIQNKYRVIETLGQNAFSQTFLATDNQEGANRRYVIKKFKPILGNPDAKNIRHWFYREASVLKRLSGNHPQIPLLYEHFVEGEDFYLVREWVEGLTLQQKVEQQGKLPAAEVEEILDSVLSFLKYVHSYGIVYRELKPSTIILRENPSSDASSKKFLPVPIYFGGVKELESTTDNAQQYVAIANQQEYIAPEQQRGKSVFASDLYSLGMTAIYLLTGKHPAQLPIDSQTKKLLWQQETFKLKIHLARVIDRAISPNLGDRFTSAEEMLNSLNSGAVNLSLPEPKESKGRFLTSEVKIISFLSLIGIGILSLTWVILNVDLAQSNHSDRDQLTQPDDAQTLLTDTLITPESNKAIDRLSTTGKIPPFPLGITQADLTDLLGQPVMNSRGYWQNSRALMYQDVVPEQIVLGYLTDTDTTKVRQAEIAFGASVDLPTIKLQAQNLLQDNYSPTIDHYINQVYFKTSDRHEFEVNDLKGLVQRNPEDYIYLAIWERGFHKL